MKNVVIIETAIRGLIKNKKRTILTMIGVIVGISSIITIISLGNAFQNKMTETIMKKNSHLDKYKFSIYYYSDLNYDQSQEKKEIFTESDINMIKNISTVKDAKILKDNFENIMEDIKTVVKNNKQKFAFEIVKNYEKNIVFGKGISILDNKLYNDYIIISKKDASKIFDDPRMAINQDILIGGNYFKIVGVYNSDDGSSFKMSSNSYKEKINTDSTSSMLEITLKKGANIEKEKRNILKKLNNYGSIASLGEYLETDTEGALEILKSVTNIITYFLVTIASISLFTAGIGIMNMMYVSVSERTLEIAIRRAVGASKLNIQIQFLLEGIMVSMAGGIIGYILGLLVSFLITVIINVTIKIDLFTVLGTMFFSITLGIIFSIIPAKKAVEKDLIKILK